MLCYIALFHKKHFMKNLLENAAEMKVSEIKLLLPDSAQNNLYPDLKI